MSVTRVGNRRRAQKTGYRPLALTQRQVVPWMNVPRVGPDDARRKGYRPLALKRIRVMKPIERTAESVQSTRAEGGGTGSSHSSIDTLRNTG